jgi:hypothetical protein
MFLKKWKQHLIENEMTYREHLLFAISHGVLCLEAGMLLIIHGLFPCVFQKAGSALIDKLNQSFNQHKQEVNDRIVKNNCDQL